jgi:flagellin
MGFRINTNVAAMNSHTTGAQNNRAINTSLERLSSGLRINKAADDASGMAIADSLRSQANSLGQAISNANDAIGIIQIADKAMDEQIKILDTIKTKATQAAQDGQTTDTRKALQADITRLLEELDNIANTTSFNGQSLLSGSFTNKEFEIGAYSNQTIKASIGSTQSAKVGSTRFETGQTVTASVANIQMTFSAVNGVNDITLESVNISTSVGTGIGELANVINKNSDKIGGVKASWNLVETGANAIGGGDITGLNINGVSLGNISAVAANDSDGRLVNAINDVKDQTGVEAYTDERGNLNLRSLDGRGIQISGTGLAANAGLDSDQRENYGRLTLTRAGSSDIRVSASGAFGGFSANGSVNAESTVNLNMVKGNIDSATAEAIGANSHSANATSVGPLGAGVTTLAGAMAVMDIADSAIRHLDKIRSDLGSVQNQLVATVNNISVTQVNVKASESQIRDVDFAQESATFQKHNLLAQSGSYAMSQANQVQQNVMKLLQ